METLRTLADKSTGDRGRQEMCGGEGALVGLRKQARGEELQRVTEF